MQMLRGQMWACLAQSAALGALLICWTTRCGVAQQAPPRYEPPVCRLDTRESAEGFGGQIADPTGAPVPGALVLLESASSGRREYTKSDADGCYFFHAEEGSYEVHGKSSGFRIPPVAVQFHRGETTRYDLSAVVGTFSGVYVTPVRPPAFLGICVVTPQGLPPETAPEFSIAGEGSASHLQADEWGCLEQEVPRGTYRVTVDVAGFRRSKLRLDLDGKPKAKTVTLVPSP
jgi:hypothetical protein